MQILNNFFKAIFNHSYILFIALVFAYIYSASVLPHGQPGVGHFIVPDAELDYLVTEHIFEGRGFYKDFSIVYPPGRFLIQALLFWKFGLSMAILSVFHVGMSLVVFPLVLLFVTYFLFLRANQKIFNLNLIFSKLMACLLAVLAVYTYIGLIRSGQEVHAVSGLMLISLLLVNKVAKWQSFRTGFLLGLVFLFRVDAGILSLLSLLTIYLISSKKNRQQLIKDFRYFIGGFFIVWGPMLVAIILNGSLFNFLYDILVLGLLIQPQSMGLPLPDNDLRLVFWVFLNLMIAFSSVLLLAAKELKKFSFRIGYQYLATFALLSYVSALGRSDEPHLWYGVVWFTPLLLFGLCIFGWKLWQKTKIHWQQILLWLVLIPLFSWITLRFKSPSIFLVGTVGWMYLVNKLKPSVISIIVAGLISSFFIFHSLAYLNMRWVFSTLPKWKNFKYEWLVDDDQELAGLEIQPQVISDLEEIKKDLPSDLEHLLIYPKNLLFNKYFGYNHPTRYIVLAYERSSYTDREIISDLKSKNVTHFLIFKEWAESTKGSVWPWIKDNTRVEKTYEFGKEEVELRILDN